MLSVFFFALSLSLSHCVYCIVYKKAPLFRSSRIWRARAKIGFNWLAIIQNAFSLRVSEIERATDRENCDWHCRYNRIRWNNKYLKRYFIFELVRVIAQQLTTNLPNSLKRHTKEWRRRREKRRKESKFTHIKAEHNSSKTHGDWKKSSALAEEPRGMRNSHSRIAEHIFFDLAYALLGHELISSLCVRVNCWNNLILQ